MRCSGLTAILDRLTSDGRRSPKIAAMLRITELRLPLDHRRGRCARRSSRAWASSDAALRSFTVFKRSYDARKKTAIVLIYTVDCEVRRRGRGAARARRRPARPRRARHPLPLRRPRAGRLRTPRPARVRSSSASAPAACSPRWCWRRWACGRSCSSAARRCASAPRTPGACGASGVLDPESNVQFGEGGAGTFSDGKLWSQISDPRHLTRKVLTEFVKAGAPRGDPLRQQAAHRHLPAGRHGREDARRDRGAGRRDPLRPARRPTCVIEDGAVRGVRARQTASSIARRPRRAGARPQRARHLRDAAASAASFMRGQAVLDRLSHRASAGADRPRALRPERRPPAARRGRLQAGAPRQQRPLGLQLLHVPGRHRGGGDLGARPRRHQRHEPVLAQRAQRQRRHRGRHHAGGLSRRTARAGGAVDPLDGIAFQRLWESRAFELGGGGYQRAGAAGRRLPRAASRRRALGEVLPSYKPGRAR